MSINIYQHRSTGQDLALGRSRGAMALLGSRQESCEVIHQQERIGNLRDQGCDKSLWNQKGPKEFRGIQLFFNMTLGHVMLCHGMSLIMLPYASRQLFGGDDMGWHGSSHNQQLHSGATTGKAQGAVAETDGRPGIEKSREAAVGPIFFGGEIHMPFRILWKRPTVSHSISRGPKISP